MFKQKLYKLYLGLLAFPLITGLIVVGWKRDKLRLNSELCGIPYSFRFRLRFYRSLVLDLLQFFHGRYAGELRMRSRDEKKWRRLGTGPGLFLTAHFHNWELLGAWMTRQGIPLLSGARPLANAWSQALLIRLRRRLRMKVVFQNLPRSALRHLQSGQCFALLWDQRVERSNTRAPLFGHNLLLDPLPEFLDRHASAPAYFGVLLPDGTLRVLQLLGSMSSPSPSSNRTLARRYHRVLELLVRTHPSSWYGLAHGRFQNRPDMRSRIHVSRETSVAPEVMVSRETLQGENGHPASPFPDSY